MRVTECRSEALAASLGALRAAAESPGGHRQLAFGSHGRGGDTQSLFQTLRTALRARRRVPGPDQNFKLVMALSALVFVNRHDLLRGSVPGTLHATAW